MTLRGCLRCGEWNRDMRRIIGVANARGAMTDAEREQIRVLKGYRADCAQRRHTEQATRNAVIARYGT